MDGQIILTILCAWQVMQVLYCGMLGAGVVAGACCGVVCLSVCLLYPTPEQHTDLRNKPQHTRTKWIPQA